MFCVLSVILSFFCHKIAWIDYLMSRPWHTDPHGVVLHIRLQPRASRNRLLGLYADALKVALTAPPVDGAANAALMTFVGQLLAVPRATVSLQTGIKSRTKQVLVRTPTPTLVIHKLTEQLARLDKKKRDD